MARRMSDVVLCLLLVAVGMATVPAASAAPGASWRDAGAPTITHLTSAFSPNADGDRDVARLRYRLPAASRASVGVFGGTPTKLLFRVPLGRQRAGAHVWTWDGRRPNRRRLPQDVYRVEVRTPGGHVEEWTEIDLTFQATVSLAQTYGRPAREVQAVYPRTRVVRDSVGLLAPAASVDEGFRRELLLVKDPEGQVVLRRNLLERPTEYVDDDGLKLRPAVWEARDRDDRALPRGRYTAVVTGEDLVGNTGSAKLPLWVSAERLVWVEETRTVVPADAATQACGWSSALGACDSLNASCGALVPSTLFRGGMSHRSGVCAGYPWQTIQQARSEYYVPVTEAVRGVDSTRVAFTGAPTNPGESDAGTLSYGGETVSSSTGGQGGWHPSWIGKGQPGGELQPRVAAGAVWTFATTGTDSFDIASFTLGLRYLAAVP